jgi:CBS domain-containing protein
MTVATLLKSKGASVVTTRPGVPLHQAIDRMKSDRIGALVVTKPVQGEIIGILSERDVVHAIATHGPAALEMPVDTVMARNARSCVPSDSVRRVMEVMTRSRSRHLVVVDDHGLAGIVSIGDVVKHRLRDMELEVGVLRDISIFGAGRSTLQH